MTYTHSSTIWILLCLQLFLLAPTTFGVTLHVGGDGLQMAIKKSFVYFLNDPYTISSILQSAPDPTRTLSPHRVMHRGESELKRGRCEVGRLSPASDAEDESGSRTIPPSLPPRSRNGLGPRGREGKLGESTFGRIWEWFSFLMEIEQLYKSWFASVVAWEVAESGSIFKSRPHQDHAEKKRYRSWKKSKNKLTRWRSSASKNHFKRTLNSIFFIV